MYQTLLGISLDCCVSLNLTITRFYPDLFKDLTHSSALTMTLENNISNIALPPSY